MQLKKVIAIPALALTAGLSLAACGSAKAPAAPPAITHTVTAPAAAPKPTTPAPTTAAPAPVVVVPAPAKTVYVAPPAPAAPANTGGNCGNGVNAGANTSCAFAQNVAADYNGPGADYENVYSPVTGQTYGMSYIMQTGNRVYATGGNNASVWFSY
jgi:hypothetical protein